MNKIFAKLFIVGAIGILFYHTTNFFISDKNSIALSSIVASCVLIILMMPEIGIDFKVIKNINSNIKKPVDRSYINKIKFFYDKKITIALILISFILVSLFSKKRYESYQQEKQKIEKQKMLRGF